MGRALQAEAVSTLERGDVTVLYRPRVEQPHASTLGDVQRLFLLLAPEESSFERLIAIGRKRLRPSARRDRFWGFVDLVLTPYDMSAALSSQVYGTKTRGLRHVAAAQPFAAGNYDMNVHGAHAHLTWEIEDVALNDAIANELGLERTADYIVSVANPDPGAWGLVDAPDLQGELFDDLELHVTIPSPFPLSLQSRFGDRRYAQLDSPEWLDHPGAELIFVGAG